MTQVSRRFHGQMTYVASKQTYVFVENNVIVPLESDTYIIFHRATKKVLGMTKKPCNSNKLVWKSVSG